jgi:DHA1 family bicyclomycin/chloramphenicol resistance-like MFS transporter
MAITAVGALLGLLALTRAGGLAAVAASLFAFLASLGFINSNATALAMEHQGERAGVASAALGATQFAIAAAASSLVGALNDGTMRPMAFVMAGCGMLAWASSAVARRGAGLALPQRV